MSNNLRNRKNPQGDGSTASDTTIPPTSQSIKHNDPCIRHNERIPSDDSGKSDDLSNGKNDDLSNAPPGFAIGFQKLRSDFHQEYADLIESFDQRLTLKPPDYPKSSLWHNLAKSGKDIGDRLFDEISEDQLRRDSFLPGSVVGISTSLSSNITLTNEFTNNDSVLTNNDSVLASDDSVCPVSGEIGREVDCPVLEKNDTNPTSPDQSPKPRRCPVGSDQPNYIEKILEMQKKQGEPEWVDWEKVTRGQILWLEFWGGWVIGLGMALLVGFSVARFSEVLYCSGYSQDGVSAVKRYSDTAWAMMDWFSFPLNKPDSQSRLSIYTVRKMHAFARKRVGEVRVESVPENSENGITSTTSSSSEPRRRRMRPLFDQKEGEGVALSQYDLAQVLLAFSGIVVMIIECIGEQKIPRKDLDDMIHCIRLIGFHLGIEDEFNPCSSLETCERLTTDFLFWSDRMFQTQRPSAYELRRTAMEGFGQTSGLGTKYWSLLLYIGLTNDVFGDYGMEKSKTEILTMPHHCSGRLPKDSYANHKNKEVIGGDKYANHKDNYANHKDIYATSNHKSKEMKILHKKKDDSDGFDFLRKGDNDNTEGFHYFRNINPNIRMSNSSFLQGWSLPSFDNKNGIVVMILSIIGIIGMIVIQIFGCIFGLLFGNKKDKRGSSTVKEINNQPLSMYEMLFEHPASPEFEHSPIISKELSTAIRQFGVKKAMTKEHTKKVLLPVLRGLREEARGMQERDGNRLTQKAKNLQKRHRRRFAITSKIAAVMDFIIWPYFGVFFINLRFRYQLLGSKYRELSRKITGRTESK